MSNSMGQQNPNSTNTQSPMMGKGCKWNVNALNGTYTHSHTHTKKQIITLAIASPTNSVMFKANCRSLRLQNGPTLHEHAAQGFHIILSKAQPALVH
jgi:hypothetical protein